MRVLSTALPAACLAALASSSALPAQHCWPTLVVIVLRDSAGQVADAGRADEVTVSPQATPAADFSHGIRTVDDAWGAPPLGVDTVPSLVWTGRGACAIDVEQVTVRRGGQTMRLLADVHVNSLRRPGPSAWVVDTPPFRAGTYRLALCALPPGEVGAPTLVPAAAWVPADASPARSCPGSP
jgi:hypothetical protein